MILYIDTTENDFIFLKLKNDNFESKKKIESKYAQAEKLLIAIDDFLQENKFFIKDVKKIIVNSVGNNFTSLRIGVITANALAYALKIPVENYAGKFLDMGSFHQIKVDYLSEPNISVGKKKII